MGTLASKALIMGIIAALGGLGLTAAPSAPLAPEATTLEASAQPEATMADAGAQPAANDHRERAHARRDAIRALNASSRAAREAAREGGMDREERAAMRTLRNARKDAIHALNLAHRASISSSAEAESTNDDSAPEHGRGRGPSRRATHGR